MRLDVALIAQHPGLSRRKAREVIEKGQVSVDGRMARDAGDAVTATSRIAWDPNRKALPRARLSLPVLYEDADLVIVDKPAGLLSVATDPDASGEDTVIARVREYVERLRPRHAFAGAAHRLDRDTSGALAVALHEEARRALRSLFRDHRAERRYLALVEGTPAADSGTIDAPIRDQYEGGRRGVARPGEASRPALTRYRVAERLHGAALLELELATGRQHQIRVHLAHIGHPVLGDAVYRDATGRPPVPVRRHMLHACVLGFTQPLRGHAVRAESPLPEDFERALRLLRTASRAPRAGRAGRGRRR
jgi:23S rRNA pseudouridine1911/1915/1917 synthase